MMRGRGRQKIVQAKLRKSENKQKKREEVQLKQLKQTLPVMKKSKRVHSSKFNSFREQFKKVVENIKNSESPNNILSDFDIPIYQNSKNPSECEEKRQLQVNFIMTVKNIYDVVNQDNKIKEGKKEDICIPEPVVYFMGSALQRLKDSKHISFIQYLEECIQIFRKSSKTDIIEFLSLTKCLKRQQKQTKYEQREKQNNFLKEKTSSSINTHINKIVLKVQKGNNQKKDKQNIEQYSKKIENSGINNRSENEIQLQKYNPILKIKTERADQEVKHTAKTNNETDLYQQKQSQFDVGVKYRQIQLKFCKSVQTQQNLIQQTPSKCRKKSETSCLSTPIRKIQDVQKCVQRCLKESNIKINGENKITGPLQEKNLVQNPLKNKQQIENLKPSLGDSNLKVNESNILTSYLQQKYSYFPKQNIKEKRLGFGRSGFDEYWNYQLKANKTPDNMNRAQKASNEDDRIDRLAAKVQKHIESNLRMIQRSKEARDQY